MRKIYFLIVFASIIFLMLFVQTVFSEDLEVMRFDCKKAFEGSEHYSCKVVVKNKSKRNIKQLSVRIDSLDLKGNLIDSQAWGLGWSLNLILPGQQAVAGPYLSDNPEIAYFKIQRFWAWDSSAIKEYDLTFKGKTRVEKRK